MKIKGLAIVGLVLAVVCFSCANDEDSKIKKSGGEYKLGDELTDVTEDVALGKSLLASRDTKGAYEAFDKVERLRGDLPDGHLGIYMVDEIILVDWLQSLITSLMNFLDDWMKSKDSGKVAGDIIRDTIEDFAQPLVSEMTDHLEEIDGDFSFYISSYPLWFYNERTVLDLGGEWDLSDATIMKGGSRIFLGFTDFLLAYDLDFDVGHFIDIELPPDADMRETLLAFINATLDALSDPDYPDFLYLIDEGYELLPQAGIEYGRGLLGIIDGFASVLGETDPQHDDIFGYLDENGDLKWDSDEPLVFPYLERVSEDQAPYMWSILNIIDLLGRSMLDGTQYDTSPDPNPFSLDALSPLLTLIGLPLPLPAIEVDLGKFYREPKREGLHDALVFILTLLKEGLEQTP